MRIIAGTKRGTKLFSPEDRAVRPTTDRVKEAMFGSIQFELSGARVLDLFSGSGALGLEAASRGAKYVVLVDCDAAAVAVIQKNVERLGCNGTVKIVKNDYVNAIRLFQNREKFDIVLIDPPYRAGLYEDAVRRLRDAGLLMKGAVLILESDEELEFGVPGIDWYKNKRFGKTYLTFGRYEGDE